MRNIIFSLILALFMVGCVDDFYELHILYVPAPKLEGEDCEYKLVKDGDVVYYPNGIMDISSYNPYDLQLMIESTLPSKKVNEIETNDIIVEKAIIEVSTIKRGVKRRLTVADGTYYINNVIPVNSIWMTSFPIFLDTRVTDSLNNLNPDPEIAEEGQYDPNFRIVINVKLEGQTKAGASVKSNEFEFSIYVCYDCFNLEKYSCGDGFTPDLYCGMRQDHSPICVEAKE